MEPFVTGKKSKPIQLVKGVTLFRRLKPVHDELQQQYKALVEARTGFVNGISLENLNLDAHACLSRDYAKTLLTLCKPARGRLAALFSEQGAAGLMYSLLYDLCLHLNHYVAKDNDQNDGEDPGGQSYPCKNDPRPEVCFARRAGDAIKAVLEQLASGEHAETEVDYDDQGLFMPDLLKNYHDDMESVISEETAKYETLKVRKVQEVVANDGKELHRREVLPTVGVLGLFADHVDDSVVQSTFLESGYNALSTYLGASLGTVSPLPPTLEEYMNQFGVFIIVALDKLETKMKLPKLLRDSCLKIFLQAFLFVAKISASEELSGKNRNKNFLSARFSVSLEDVLTLFDDGYDRIKCSACSYYRELNGFGVFGECAKSLEDLNQSKIEIWYSNTSTETTKSEIEYGELVNLSNYLNSIIMKSLLLEVETSLERKQATCTAVNYCSLILSESVDSLMDERFKEAFLQRAGGFKLAYCCTVKFLLFSLSPFFFHRKVSLRQSNFFPTMFEQMEKLPHSIDVTEQEDGSQDSVKDIRLVSCAVADAICNSFLSVLVFGTKQRASTFDRYMKIFFSERLPTGLEHAIPFLPSKSLVSVIKKLGKLVENVKFERSSKSTHDGEVTTRDHHVGCLRSPLYTSYVDPRVCTVATFVKLLLAVYRGARDDEAEKCLDTLKEVGLCCCFDSEFILTDIIPSMVKRSPEIVGKTLSFMEGVFMGTLDGARLAPVSYCSECSLSMVSVEVEGSDKEESQFLFLEGDSQKTSRFFPYEEVSSTANRWFRQSNAPVCYRSLKWAGMKAYAAFKDEFDQTYQEHISRLARFGRKEIQSVLLDYVYEPMLLSLNDAKKVNGILNDPNKIAALQFIFSGLSVLLLTNSVLSLKMTDSFWKMWSKLVLHSQNHKNGSLLSACYEFACAAVMSHLTVECVQKVVPFPQKIKPHSECLKELESSIINVNMRWSGLFFQSIDKTEEVKAQAQSVAAVWSCLAEFCCLPQFVSFLEKRFFESPTAQSSSLDPLKTLITLLECLATKESWAHGALLSCPNETFHLVRSLLKVISICPTWEESRPAALTEVRKALNLHLLTEHIKPFMFAVLDVNCSAAANLKGGQLWATSGDTQHRRRNQAGTISAYFSTLDHNRCQVELWPQLLEEVLNALMYRTDLIVEQLHQAREDSKRKLKSKDEEAEETDVISSAVAVSWSFFSAAVAGVSTSGQDEQEVEAFSDSDDEAGENYHDKEVVTEKPRSPLVVFSEGRLTKDRLADVIQMLEESLSKVIEVCEDAPPFVEVYLTQTNVMDKLLEKFDKVLRNSHKFGGVPGLVLRLWARFASTAVTTDQLANFFKIFMGRKPPVSEMLSVLECLLLHSLKTPLSYLQFSNTSVRSHSTHRLVPHHLAGYDQAANSIAPRFNSTPLHGFVTRSRNLSRQVKNFCNYRSELIHENVTCSGVNQARIACVLPSDTSSQAWMPITSDTTIALWCKLNKDTRLSDQTIDMDCWNAFDFNAEMKSGLHMFTVGVKKLMLSAFLSARSGYCHLKFFRQASESDLATLLACCDLNFSVFLDGDWHFVTFSFAGINTKKLSEVKVSCSVDAQFLDETVIELPPLGSISPDAPFVLLGHRGLVITDETGAPLEDVEFSNIDDSLSMTSLTMWKLPSLDHLTTVLLMSFGKDVENYLAAQREASADLLKNFMTVEVMEYLELNCPGTLVPDFLCSKLENSVLNLNKSLLFHFNSHNPEEFVLYDVADRAMQDVCGRYGHATVRYTLHFEGLLQPVRQQGALQALLHLGGVRALLYLLARVVELDTVDYTAVPRATKSNRPNSSSFRVSETGETGESCMHESDYTQLVHWSGKPVQPTEDEPVLCVELYRGYNPGVGSCQAACLQLLYSCVRQSPELGRQFHACNGTEMVMRLLCSPKMDTRLEVFKVLLDQCFSESMITLEPISAFLSVVEDAPVQGRFVPPSCRVLVTDACLLASLLQHWHGVELRKRDVRDAAYDKLVANMDTAGMDSTTADVAKSAFRESLNLPERLVSDWRFGPCHLVDVLHRAVVSVLTRSNSFVFDRLNFQLLHRSSVLQSCLHIAQELHVRDWPSLQVKPLLLRDLLAGFLPEKRKELPYWNTVHASLQCAFTEVLQLLVLSVDPHAALKWNADTCTARLNRFICQKNLDLRSALYENRLRNLVDTELAEEVTEDVVRPTPVLDATVAAEGGLGVITSEDKERLDGCQSDKDICPKEMAVTMLHANAPETLLGVTSEESSPPPTRISVEQEGSTLQVLFTARNTDGPPFQAFKKELEKEEESREEMVARSRAESQEVDPELDALVGKEGETDGGNGAVSPPTSPDSKSSRSKSPPFEEPSSVAKAILPEMAQTTLHLITALYDFLRLQDGNGLENIVQNTLKPHHLSILANHGNVDVRCMVVKILRDVLYRCSGPTCAPYKEQLVVVHHQLACHGSSTELLEECFLLMVSIPAPKSELSTPLELITTNLDTRLSESEVQERLWHYSSPLLAVLPKVSGVEVKATGKVLDFLATVVGHCSRTGGGHRLLAMPALGESLLLTMDASLSSTAYDSAPIVNVYADLVRSLLLLGDDLATRGFDLVTKFYVFCEHQSSYPKRYSACLKALAKILVSAFKNLLKAMLVASSLTLEQELKKSASKLSEAYTNQILKDENKKRLPFIPDDRHSAYYADFLEESPLAQTLGKGLTTTNLVDRTTKLLKMATNFVSLIEYNFPEHSTVPPFGVCWSLPLFLLDLHASMLRSLDPLPSPTGRMGFLGNVTLPRHQFERLSLEHASEVRRFLPELVCMLLHPKADRLAKRALLGRLQFNHKLFLLSCRNADGEIFKMVCYFLWKSKSVYSQSRLSSVFSNLDSTLDRFSFDDKDEKIAGIVAIHFKQMITKRKDRARSAVDFDEEASISRAVLDHKPHEKVISDLFNRFLVMHAKLNKKVFERVNFEQESFSLQTLNWLDLCAASSGPLSPWNRNTSMWWELVENTNRDQTRSLVVQKAFNVGKQFFKENSSKHPLKRQKPLESVLGSDDEVQPMVKIGSIESSEGEFEVKYTGKGWVIKPGIEFWGTIFVVADVGISFKGKKTVFGWSKAVEKSSDSAFHVYFDKMVSVRKRSYRLNETAFEVHLRDRTSLFFVCGSKTERDNVVCLLLEGAGLQPEKPILEEVAKATAAWQARKMTNFDYLMLLNSLAGRNYNDLNQYPVFPYVLADYTSEVLDLDDPATYRDLSKPMPVQTKDKEEYFIEKYRERSGESDLQGIGIPFHYTSLYSNSIVVKTYLVRLPPFTLHFLHFQGGRFDHPSRTFHSVEKAYKLITRESYTDFKEAIPEMYYLPEMFSNKEDFNMSGTETNCDIDKVVLPAWSEGNPRKFVLFHRAALESNYVTENLPQWIDLIFGFKQCGKKCVEAVNKYHPSGYPEHLGNDKVPADVWNSMTGLYGEVPLQLFKNSAHPMPRKEAVKVSNMEFLQSISPADNLKGMRFGSFAFFPANARADVDTLRAGLPAGGALQHNLVMTGDAREEFVAAPIGTMLLVDDSAKTQQKFHLVQPSSSDGVLRVWSPKFSVSYPITTLPSYTKVTCCSADDGQVWLGTDCGQVLFYKVDFLQDYDLDLCTVQCASSQVLQGHGAPVTALCVCPHFNVCVTGDAAGYCCVWDVHKPGLVRRVLCFSTRVTRILVSKTSGDWLCATDGGTSPNLLHSPPSAAPCRLRLYTLNGELAAETALSEPVLCLTMTSLREGRAVNVIAVVMRSHLALYSSWDLQALKNTKFSRHDPIDFMRWSDDSQQLAVQWQSGERLVYQSAAAVSKKEPPMKITDVAVPARLRLPQ